MQLTPERWQEVKLVLERVLLLTPAERAAELAQLRANDADLGAEVESLLHAHEGNPDYLEDSGFKGLGVVDQPDVWLDRVLGAYRLVEQIGQGGMGTVYRAVRADGLYSRSVAIKVIRSALSTDFFLRRFANERTILARLDHPNVARLLDGGASGDGIPYVVMEFVDGVPIDQYCKRAGLSIRERLKLFSAVCAAVQYAHQNLIVHRDLKPGNILVTAENQPKLVDFGIGKILDLHQELGTEQARTALPMMTPEFASPEQLRGEPVTTASDLYSLGVVLYELLTGHRPYGAANRPTHEMLKIVCEVDPPRPSTMISDAVQVADEGGNRDESPRLRRSRMKRLRRALQGDLDSIVLKALRKDPRERYATVEQLRDDIHRHLEGLPVTARRGTTAYFLRKFLARHATGAAVAGGVAVLLVVSALISVREAGLARTEAARAERRFNEVRELAGSLVFDVHDAIRDLPGSTPARKILIDRALKYLDGLSRESANDQSLMRELAAAYERVGEVEGHFLQDNLGDAARSLDSYQKALMLRQRLASGGNPEDRLALAGCRRRVANQLWATGNIRGARDAIAEAIAVASALPQNMSVLSEESAEYQLQAEIFGNTEMGSLADAAAALQSVRREEQTVAAMLTLSPDSAEVQHSYQLSMIKHGDMLQVAGDLPGALSSFRHALDVAQRLQERNPTAVNARSVAIAHNHVAIILDLLDDGAGSLSHSREALEIYRRLLSADPRNERLQRGVSLAEMNVGTLLVLRGEPADGLPALDDSVKVVQSMVAASPKNLRNISMLAGHYEGRGDARMHLRESRLAAADYTKACELYEQTRSADPDDAGDTVLAAECHTRLGRALSLQGKTDGAVRDYQEALELLKPSLVVANPDVDALYLAADSYAGLGDSELAKADAVGKAAPQYTSHWQSARTWYASSLETWQKIPRTRYRRSPSLPVDGPDIVAEKLQRSESALAAQRAPPGKPPAQKVQDSKLPAATR